MPGVLPTASRMAGGPRLLWFMLALCLLLFIFSLRLFWRLRRHFSGALRAQFDRLLRGLGELEPDIPQQPRSLQSLEPVLLPRVRADFPELNVESMRAEIRQRLEDAFHARAGEPGRPGAAARAALFEEWWAQFRAGGALRGTGVYRVVLKDYERSPAQCRLLWQAGFYYEKEGRGGYSARVDVLYLCEYGTGKEAADAPAGLNCPHCGAPLAYLGSKVCDYCRTPVNADWYRAWRVAELRTS